MGRSKHHRRKPKERKLIAAVGFMLLLLIGLAIVSSRMAIKTVVPLELKEQEIHGMETTEHVPNVLQETEATVALLQTQPTEGTNAVEPDSASTEETEDVQQAEQTDSIDSTEGVSAEGEAVEAKAVAYRLPEISSEKRTVFAEIPEGYAEVLQQYREAIMMDSDEFDELYSFESDLDLKLSINSLQELYDKGELASVAEILEHPKLSERYPYVASTTLYNGKKSNDINIFDIYHYAYYNIDGSRRPELLIGTYNDYREEYDILAIYAHTDNEPRLLQAISDNARWHLTIYTDGTFCCDGSGGASEHYWSYYKIHDSFELDDLIASFTVTYDTPGCEYLIEAASGYEAMHTPVDDIVWYPLFD